MAGDDALHVLSALGLANLAASAAIVLVLLAREPVRRMAGPRIAYWMWGVPLIAGLAVFLPSAPARVIHLAAPAAPALSPAPVAAASELPPTPVAPETTFALDIPALAMTVWLFGALVFLAVIAIRQARTLKSLGPMAGPAVVGLVRPRVVLPADFEQRFDARERDLILVHEKAHIAAGDTRVNAVLALATCVNWFNPLVHLAARLARLDQELACDAAVVAKYPAERRTYAEALLKTQVAPASLPLGCTWPAKSSGTLKARVTMLARKSPGRAGRIAGIVAASAAALAAGVGAWAAQPQRPPVYVFDAPADADIAAARVSLKELEGRRAALEQLMEPVDAQTEAAYPAQATRAREWLDTRIEQLKSDIEREGDGPGAVKIKQQDSKKSHASDEERKARLQADVYEAKTREALAWSTFEELTTAEKDLAELLKRYGERHPAVVVTQQKVDALRSKLQAIEQAGASRIPVLVLPPSPPTLEQLEEQARARGAQQGMTKADLDALEKQLIERYKAAPPQTPEEIKQKLDQLAKQIPAEQAASAGGDPAWPATNATLVCDNWPSIWGGDPKVNMRALKRTTPVAVTFDSHGLPSIDVSATAAAFPRDIFPAGLGDGEASASRMTKDAASYRIKSKTVMDTFTFGSLDQSQPSIMWHRVRITKDGPVDMLMEGHCRRPA
ncbi:MAG TPA: M56 family metallopeptidase [Hyphomonadaceae bacterium]|nr:M56 family metallopeptidase [Hyphomonadaceae bacterium]